jgi:hypothetical protein
MSKHHGSNKSCASAGFVVFTLAAGSQSLPLLQYRQPMADWKQITARIRRARTGKDPASQLSNLYEKTRDAMVAFELARYFETAGLNEEAAKWYATAAERFRRADWKTKAQEAATRLGGAPVQDSPDPEAVPLAPLSMAIAEPDFPVEHQASASEAIVASGNESPGEPLPSDKPANGANRRHRGRRGGRNRRKGSVSKEGVPPSPTRQTEATPPRRLAVPDVTDESLEPRHARVKESMAVPPLEPSPDAGGVSLRGRYGDPGLSSRLSLLEMQFRRLLTCPPAKFDEADRAPVGPGVFLLTDSDLTSYYYVEACQTLRVAVANLLRGGASRRGADSIKPQLAEFLGIAESRVSKYLADHCVVRWLQLDEGASHFAHYVIAVLRPSLNE